MKFEMKSGPFIKDKDMVSKTMWRLIFSLIPIILFSIYKSGYLIYQKGYTNVAGIFYPLIFIVVGMLSSFVTEECYYIIRGKRGQELLDSVFKSYGMMPGLFMSLVLPINTPLAILFIGGIVATVIGKLIYGGFGKNIFNPALIGVLFVITCYGALIGTKGGYLNRYELDAISSATPLTNVKMVETINYDNVVKPYGDLSTFLIGFIPGSVGETSSLLILIAFIYLAITKTIKWKIPVFYVGTFLVMTTIYSYIVGLESWYILFELLTGGLLFGSVFMATDPVTSPVTPIGQILYGIALGIMTFALRNLTNYPEGVMTSILFMNMFVFLFDKIGSRIYFNKWYYLVFVFIGIIMIGGTIYIGKKSIKKPDDVVTSDYVIVSKDTVDNNTIYVVTQKGFGGNIKAKITFDSKNMTGIEILENYESEDRYSLVMKENFLDKLLNKQHEIDTVDTISGATITSKAIKEMVANTINDFIGETGRTIDNPNMSLISLEQDRDALVYVVKTDSFGGTLELQVVMKNGVVRTVVPKNYNDTCISERNKSNYYQCPEYLENNYIKSLILNQDNLDGVDTVSGATISSKAIKEALRYVKEGRYND